MLSSCRRFLLLYLLILCVHLTFNLYFDVCLPFPCLFSFVDGKWELTSSLYSFCVRVFVLFQNFKSQFPLHCHGGYGVRMHSSFCRK